MDAAETPLPAHRADILRRSRSKQAQQSFPRFKTMPRGVILLVGNPWPRRRASNADEKNGKLGSTNSPHGPGTGISEGASWAKEAIASSNPQSADSHGA